MLVISPEYNRYEGKDFLTCSQHANLTIQVRKLFEMLDTKFNSYIYDENSDAVYFDEMLIILKEDQKINVIFHFNETQTEREEITYKEINTIVTDFEEEFPYDMYLFLKDQSDTDFDYITRAKVNDTKVLILLNNIEYSLNEIQAKYAGAWNAMNETNARLYAIIQAMIQHIN